MVGAAQPVDRDDAQLRRRADVAEVWDEPFYAAYLAATGKDHPMRAEVLAAQPQDWRVVARACADVPGPPGTVLYQKHMTQHMLPAIRPRLDGRGSPMSS